MSPDAITRAPDYRGALAGWDEDDVVLISALEHWSYCPRQCALIHIEQTYDENLFTLRGRRTHERAHGEDGGRRVETDHGVRTVRGLDLWSDRLGLRGKADVVEFRADAPPLPVEYKSGSLSARRNWRHEDLQLCAQALCLEEMLGVEIPEGGLYAAASRKRRVVSFSADLRHDVERATVAVREMLSETRLPTAVNDARCPNCSLYDACLPDLAASPARVRGVQSMLFRCDERGWEETEP